MEIGVWVWGIGNREEFSGSLMESLDFLAEHGVSRLYVKAADGIYEWTQFAKVINPLKDRGFEVWSWSYCYGEDPQREAELALKAIDLGSAGHVLDAEAEFRDLQDNAVAAEYLCSTVKAFTDKPLWYTSFAYPRFHPRFPWQAFNQHCDGAMPQVFSAYGGVWSPTETGSIAATDYSNAGLLKPIVPVWEMFTPESQSLSAGEYVAAWNDALEFGRLDIFRWGIVGAMGYETLRMLKGGAAPHPCHDLVNLLGYLQGDLADDFEKAMLGIRQEQNRRGSMRKGQVGKYLANLETLVNTLKTEGK